MKKLLTTMKGNWEAVGGSIVGSKELDLIGLTGGNSVVGHAIILHNLTDDCTNNNLGNAGGRLAFCVIGVGNPS
jgi:Cu/Zn superoxide dismutase